MRRALIVILSATLLAACGAPESGRVVGRRHEPEHTTIVVVCHRAGKTTFCNPVPIHHAEAWKLELRDGDRHGWRAVDHSAYRHHPIGSTYTGGDA